MTKDAPAIGWSRDDIARRLARDIPNGWYVNLGIGIPELVARFVPEGRTLVYHTENGLLGMGPSPAAGKGDPELINAGKRQVTALAGASFFDQATSFAMIRGGHLDLSVLGALQVASNGDLANWSTGGSDAIPAVGGAMDLVAGVKRVVVMMEHANKKGESKIIPQCTLPLTGRRCIDMIITELCVLEMDATNPAKRRFVLKELAPGVTTEEVLAKTTAEIFVPASVGTVAC